MPFPSLPSSPLFPASVAPHPGSQTPRGAAITLRLSSAESTLERLPNVDRRHLPCQNCLTPEPLIPCLDFSNGFSILIKTKMIKDVSASSSIGI